MVENQGVKLHHFTPSGRSVLTVVGTDTDHLVDYDPNSPSKSYCSCDDFHFRVLSGSVPECYHLLAAKEALREGIYSVIEFSDDELPGFMKALITDVFRHLS